MRPRVWIAFLYAYSVGIPLGLLLLLPFFLGPNFRVFLALAIVLQGTGLVIVVWRFGPHGAISTRTTLIEEVLDEEEEDATEHPGASDKKRRGELTAQEVVAEADHPDLQGRP